MKDNRTYRMDQVMTGQIKRMPGLKNDVSENMINKIREFAEKRGFYLPVILSEEDGRMTLLAGAATFKACLKERRTEIPAVIVRTEGDADNLMLSLQTTELDEAPSAMFISAAIVQLIDVHGISRKHIAETLGKSPSWINRMEGLCRKLNETVQNLVVEGHITSRSAQEIARLPDIVQTPFAISVGNEFLSKNSVAYLVNRYLNEDTSLEERDRIIHTPKLVLPDELKSRKGRYRDNSDSARLSRAMARCLDSASSLIRLFECIDISGIAIHTADVAALADRLAVLKSKLQAIFYPGGKDLWIRPPPTGLAGLGGDAVD